MRLILASASPRRADLLRAAGFSFEITPADIDETPAAGEAAATYTLRVAREKARCVAGFPSSAEAVVLAADTEVVIDCRILGKPATTGNAAAMLRLLSGVAHDVLTAVVVRRNDREISSIVTTRVQFAPLSDQDIDWYIASGEPMGKAGAYAIQGLGARFVERIEGSWSGVVGLPIAAVHRLLREVQ
jgi:septum formation protein